MARATQRQISGPNGLAANHQPFEGSHIYAVTGYTWGSGVMPEEHKRRYYADAKADKIIYTVVSYSTPIAWVLSDGTVIKPPVKYSVTTSRHQSLLAWL